METSGVNFYVDFTVQHTNHLIWLTQLSFSSPSFYFGAYIAHHNRLVLCIVTDSKINQAEALFYM